MNEIAAWIKKIITVLILAGFLEMILPNNELKGVTKMIIGLLIILILAQPVLQTTKLPAEIVNMVPVIAEAGITAADLATTGRIIKEGLALRAGLTAGLQKRNREMLTEKIKSGIRLIDGVELLDVRTEFIDPGVTGYPDLKKVKIRVRLSAIPANSRSSSTSIYARQQLTGRRIRDTIKLFTNLTDEQIEVTWNG